LLVLGLVLGPRQARAAFLGINGLDRSQLVQRKVAVGLVRVIALKVTWRTAHAVSGHVDLALEDLYLGPRPPRSALVSVPYSAGVGANSAWPDFADKPAGRYLVMAWESGHPCGEASAVHLGERFSLPLIVSGAGDSRVAAVKSILAVVTMTDAAARSKRLHRLFDEAVNPYLALFADTALNAQDPDHHQSAARYTRLLTLVSGAPGSDEELGWPVVQELTRFPPIRDHQGYERWHHGSPGPATDGSWPSFADFRRMVQNRLRSFAAGPRTEVNLRRSALSALATPPCFVGIRGDRLDAAVIGIVGERLRDPNAAPEIRRDAIRALLTMASTVRSSDRQTARRLIRIVQDARRREKDPEERALIQRRLDELARDAPP
jgi:hypothetical protein